MVVDHIMRRYGKEPVNYYHYVTRYPDVHAAGIRIFGTWKGVIEACGLDYSTVRLYRTWSKEKILKEIKKHHAKGDPLSSNYAQKNYKPLYMAAVKRFKKGWKEAVTMAGVDYDKVRLRRSMTPDQIKKEILDLHKKGISLAYTNMRANYQYLMAAGMKKLGNGSWDAARKACGIDIDYRSLGQRRVRGAIKEVAGSRTLKSKKHCRRGVKTRFRSSLKCLKNGRESKLR
jgi:hypothetical protein